MKQFTYYCGEHRDQTRVGDPPSMIGSPFCCTVCSERMFWVPDGGTTVPETKPAIVDGQAVLLFHTAAEVSRACRLHAPTCNMVNTARARNGRGVVKLIAVNVQEAVDDLVDRGWPVKSCKCLKGAS